MTNVKTKLTLLLASSLTIMSVITISPALPGITNHFSEVTNAQFWVQLVLTIPALFIALVAPIAGRLIDRYGRVRLLWIAIIIYIFSGTAGYYLENLFAILTSRAVLGVAVGISMTVVITLIADYYEGQQRQKLVGIQIAFMSLAGIIFISLGGFLADFHWRFPFLIYGLALPVLPLTIMYLKEPSALKKDLSIQKHVPGIIWILFFNTMLMWILFFIIPTQIPFLLKELNITQSTFAGMAIATSTLFSAISSFSYGRIKNKLSFTRIYSIGYGLMGLAYFMIYFTSNYFLIIMAMCLAGLGMGLMIPNTNMWVMKITPPDIRGREIGKLTTFWFLGQFLSPIITYPLLSSVSISGIFLFAALIMILLGSGFVFFRINETI